MTEFSSTVMLVAILLGGSSLVYVAACLVVSWRWHRRDDGRDSATPNPNLPTVSILKPLSGLEPDLERNLRSFCDQTYPTYEVLFGVQHANDPALGVARRVVAAFPSRDIKIVIGHHPIGANPKVATLAHLAALAQHEVLVIADSDIRVGPEYLRAVVQPLADPGVGVVTCLYRGAPTGTLWSRLAALGIDEWFAPSVLLGRALGLDMYCSGATMAIRRDTLDTIGGFDAITHVLADDYEVGRRVRQIGLRIELSYYEVETTVVEPSLKELVSHELRWARTIRAVEPTGNAFMFVTYSLPMTLVAALGWHRHLWVLALPIASMLLRIPLHALRSRSGLSPGTEKPEGNGASVGLVPVRDLLSFLVWCASFTSHRVVWRQNPLYVLPDGALGAGEEGIPA